MKVSLFLLTTLFLLLSSSNALACSCAYTDPAGAYNEAAAVFIGKMIGGTERHDIPGNEGKVYGIESGDVSFQVAETFKGNLGMTLVVQIASNKGTSCGTYGLVRGVDYVVYAYSNKDKPNAYSTGVCTRTRALGGDNEDLKFLRALPPKGSGGNIKGSIWLDTKVTYGGGAKRMPNIPVTIQATLTGRIFKVVTDAIGEFELNKVAAGKYKITPTVPKNYFIEEASDDEVTVDDLGTASTGFYFSYDGHINGRLIDKDGNVYDDGFFELEGKNKLIYGQSTGEKGVFTVDGIPPGTYLLFIEIKNEDYKKNRNYYYPGTYEIAKAKKITIGLGQKIDIADFSLPSEFRVKTISGKVSWSDGKPASGIYIYSKCQKLPEKNSFFLDDNLPTVESAKDGSFEIRGFAGTEYSLRASNVHPQYADQKNALYARPQQIVFSSDIKDIELILSENELSKTECPKIAR